MSQTDITVLAGRVKEQPHYTCILSGRPCSLVPVTLRRMVFLPGLWLGWKAVVVLPLEKAPALAVWQYMRTLRPYAVLFAIILPFLAYLELDVRPGSFRARAMVFAILAIAVAVWIVLGLLLKRFEFVRLLDSSDRAGTVTIRFSTAGLAQRAREVLVLPEPDSNKAIAAGQPVQGKNRQQTWAHRLGSTWRRVSQRLRGAPIKDRDREEGRDATTTS